MRALGPQVPKLPIFLVYPSILSGCNLRSSILPRLAEVVIAINIAEAGITTTGSTVLSILVLSSRTHTTPSSVWIRSLFRPFRRHRFARDQVVQVAQVPESAATCARKCLTESGSRY